MEKDMRPYELKAKKIQGRIIEKAIEPNDWKVQIIQTEL